jgi:hypothetical protein
MTAVAAARSDQPVAGDGLLHPVPLVAICLLILNDHILKVTFSGVVTGKLSDFAGLAFFPLFLQATWEVASSTFRDARVGDRRVLWICIAATALAFSAIKLFAPANDLASALLESAQWLVGLGGMPAGARAFALDPTDLIALPALAVAYVIGSARAKNADL